MKRQVLTEDDVLGYESRLREAMLHSDVVLLEQLLSPELIFTTHTGQVIGKADDVATHRSGLLKIDVLELTDSRIVLLGAAAVVTVQARIEGSFQGKIANGTFRFMRVWARGVDDTLQIVAGQSTQMIG